MSLMDARSTGKSEGPHFARNCCSLRMSFVDVAAVTVAVTSEYSKEF
jgi:hypothetical protein